MVVLEDDVLVSEFISKQLDLPPL